MILCNHFAITTTYLHGCLQIYCKKRFFTETSCSVTVPNLAQFVEQNLVRVPSRPLSGKKHKTKKSQISLRLSFWSGKRDSNSLL